MPHEGLSRLAREEEEMEFNATSQPKLSHRIAFPSNVVQPVRLQGSNCKRDACTTTKPKPQKPQRLRAVRSTLHRGFFASGLQHHWRLIGIVRMRSTF